MIKIGGRGRTKSQLNRREQAEVDRRWRAAEAASRTRLSAARTFGEESPEAREAWEIEQRAWDLAIPRGGY